MSLTTAKFPYALCRPHTLFPRESLDGFSLNPQRSSHPQWTAQELSQATGGTWAIKPPEDWRAFGFAFTLPSFFPGAMVGWERKGLSLLQIRQLRPYLSGILCKNPEECLDLDLPTLVVPDMDQAIRKLGKYARDGYQGKVLALTGSAGKTTVTHMLADALAPFGMVDYSRGSANLCTAVGITLASMSKDLSFWVLEVAYPRMQLSSGMIRPHVAFALSLAEAHTLYGGTLHDLAVQKSLIFDGMEEGGIAIINRDMREYDIFESKAQKKKLRLIRFGTHPEAEVRLLDASNGYISLSLHGTQYRLACPLPAHMARNILAVLACVDALGFPLEQCLPALTGFQMLPGRGKIHHRQVGSGAITLMDDSYNANIGSMIAAVSCLETSTPDKTGRLAILGDIAELGAEEQQKHLELGDPILKAAPDRLLLCGPLMRPLWDRLKFSIKGAWFSEVQNLEAEVLSWIKANDSILVKSSGHRLLPVVKKLLSGSFSPLETKADAKFPVIAFIGNVNPECLLGRLDVLTKADFSLINLECTSTAPRLEQLNALAEAGVGLVIAANNHNGCGPEVLPEQKALLKAAGLRQAGAGADSMEASAPTYAQAGEYTVAVFAVDCAIPHWAAGAASPGIWHFPPRNPAFWFHELAPRIALARRKAHIVLVAAHWAGGSDPGGAQKEIARAIIAAGADAVLGTASHSLHGMEICRNRPIIHFAEALKDSGVFTLKIAAHGVIEICFYPVRRENDCILPATGETAAFGITNFVQKSAALGTRLEVLPDCARLSLAVSQTPLL